jgi:hypothetical protein
VLEAMILYIHIKFDLQLLSFNFSVLRSGH